MQEVITCAPVFDSNTPDSELLTMTVTHLVVTYLEVTYLVTMAVTTALTPKIL